MTKLPPVLAKPYLLHNTIRHYAWGTAGPDAYIPRLLGIEPEPDIPYAELWLGAHHKAPSQVVIEDAGDLTLVPLDQWVARYPAAILGEHIAARFDGQFPFLTKVLSAGTSLSIQAHPDKKQAERLHARDPKHYADDNHKPEITVALDGLAALMGFKPYPEILQALQAYPELADFLGNVLVAHVLDGAGAETGMQRAIVHALFLTLIERARVQKLVYAGAVDALVARMQYAIRENGGATETETRFLDLHGQYGSSDVGLFAFLLFNLVHLAPGEALFTPAGVPHAYLGGNIIECMANSDNVVRVGLTPKFKDAETLLEIVDTTPQVPQVMAPQPGQVETVYLTPAQEFTLTQCSFAQGTVHGIENREGPAIMLVTRGQVDMRWGDPGHLESMTLHQGESVLIPHALRAYQVVGRTPAQVFCTSVPAVVPTTVGAHKQTG